ncbi:hypothetical protein BHE74_00029734, partial [Ensete ventricosum]
MLACFRRIWCIYCILVWVGYVAFWTTVIQDILVDKDDGASSGHPETISNELASAISDGLYFYEQVPHCSKVLDLSSRYNTNLHLYHPIDMAFHHFREERGISEPLRKHRELERLLREEYHSLEAFRAKEKAEKRLPEKSVAAAEAAAPMTQKSHHSCAVELLPALPIFYE